MAKTVADQFAEVLATAGVKRIYGLRKLDSFSQKVAGQAAIHRLQFSSGKSIFGTVSRPT
jgi:hypothetical protein